MFIPPQVMKPRGEPLDRYSEYLAYVGSGEQRGTMSYDEWLALQEEN